MRVRLLGPVDVTVDGAPRRVSGLRRKAVLAVLGLHGGQAVSLDRLIDVVWQGAEPLTARNSLQSHISYLRTVFGDRAAIVARPPGYALDLGDEPTDVAVAERLIRRAADEADQATRAGLLREALGLWRGEPLADVSSLGWLQEQANRLADLRLAASRSLIEARLNLGEHLLLVPELTDLAARHPFDEELHARLMLALYRSGRQADALAAYQRLRESLDEGLGIDPGAAVRDLHAAVLRQDPTLDLMPRAVAVPVDLPADPMLRPAQLPAPVGYFTGRDAVLSALDELPGGDCRIAVLAGPPGIGKTALAVEWGHLAADRFPDGHIMVDLRGSGREETPATVLGHLLRRLGVPPDRVPVMADEQVALYRSLLHGRRMLVIADDAGTAAGVLPLVPAWPGSLLVVTSRSSLAALATHHAVRQLDLDPLSDDESVALLGRLLGAARVAAAAEATAELARLCDGNPLALRIAGAKLATEPDRPIADLVAELAGADRLDRLSVDAGSRSVAAVFTTAYRALPPPAATLFRRVGLLGRTGFHVHLAAAVSGQPATQVLQELATAHLVVETAPDRYRFHDLVALFARQCALADESPEAIDGVFDRAVDWYLAVADAANRLISPGHDRVVPVVRRPPARLPFAADRPAALAFLDSEQANLLPLVRLCAERDHPAAWQLTYLLTGYFDARGNWAERVELCTDALAAARRYGDGLSEGLMLSALGVARIMTHDYEQALVDLDGALHLMRAADDLRGVGHVYNNIAFAHSGRRDFGPAVESFRQALAIHSASGNQLGVALALNNIGHTLVRMGQPEQSFDDLTRAMNISREIGNRRLEAAVLHSIGEADLHRGAYDEALRYLGEALAAYRALGNRHLEAQTLDGLGLVHLDRGDHPAAADRFREALDLARALGDPHLQALAHHHLGRVRLASGDLVAAATELRRALDLRARTPDPHEQARLHRSLGELAERSGDEAGAVRHRRMADRLDGTTGASSAGPAGSAG